MLTAPVTVEIDRKTDEEIGSKTRKSRIIEDDYTKD